MSALKNHIRSLPAAERQDRTQVISHELRTPLAIIRGYAQMIGEESDGQLEHLTGPLLEAVERMGHIVEALVDFEEQPSVATDMGAVEATGSRIPLNHLLNRIAQQVTARHPACRVDVVLDLDGPNALPASTADAFGRALEAVLDNAVRFTPQGKVTVRSRVVSNSLQLTVLDEGPGLPQGAVSLTKPFEQGSQGMARRHGGLGLGLHVAKKALASLHGTLQLQSRSDRSGARVVLTIPVPAARTVLRPVKTAAPQRKAA
jgi:signal transduction histidine kinase